MGIGDVERITGWSASDRWFICEDGPDGLRKLEFYVGDGGGPRQIFGLLEAVPIRHQLTPGATIVAVEALDTPSDIARRRVGANRPPLFCSAEQPDVVPDGGTRWLQSSTGAMHEFDAEVGRWVPVDDWPAR